MYWNAKCSLGLLAMLAVVAMAAPADKRRSRRRRRRPGESRNMAAWAITPDYSPGALARLAF